MRIAILGLLFLSGCAAAQVPTAENAVAQVDCNAARPASELIGQVVGLIPAVVSRHGCAGDAPHGERFEPIFPMLLTVPGEGPRWEYRFIDSAGWTPPQSVLSCEPSPSSLGSLPEGVTAVAHLCQGRIDREGGEWVFLLRYAEVIRPGLTGTFGELVVAARAKENGDG